MHRHLIPILIAALGVLMVGCKSPTAERLGSPAPGQAIWDGTWTSDEYPLLHGQVAVMLRDPLTAGESAPVPAAVHYSLLSLYRPGRTVETSFIAQLDPEEHAAGNNQESPVRAPTLRFIAWIKGGPESTDQTIRYDAVVPPDAQVIEGTYESKDPSDHGRFRVERKRAG